MIDLHASDAAIAEYVFARYRHLSPAASPGLRGRMAGDESGRGSVGDRGDVQSWLTTPHDMLSPEDADDRAQGALLGLAIGDAVGTTLEFQPRDARHVEDMVGGGPFRLDAGQWTDDTSMALCLADALLADRRYQPRTFARLLVRWYREGYNASNGRCFDIGNATRTAIEGHEAEDGRWQGNASDHTAGNGSLVRVAPVAIAARSALDVTWRLSGGQSRATHAALEAISACQLLGMRLHHALRGAPRAVVMSPWIATLSPRAQIINAGEYKHKTRDQIRSSGYVIDTLEAALWAVWHGETFEEAVLLAANLADDADSVAAVAGQLAGAIHGLRGIPERWMEQVTLGRRIAQRATQLSALELGHVADRPGR
ncbi:ADP-ribosylglycohydrolase [Sphingomonas sp. Leaf23]|uniref:ADP-ribosylarginine hydrolase Tri1 n=1 Tax=Sphingomonas sp. Leaf23 TaxID=1735689 RepID=UPI0006F58FC0|nr:ADP-ribosylarginine hydrolase Tri1 [Sphingomonas sp. Leaf23]KQM81655.1 ADP-ribosylglycohydrolase [Sphingomonas sp. Leaf23]